MTSPAVCFALIIFHSCSALAFAVIQESTNEQKIAEMQTTIENLKSELEQLKNVPNAASALQVPVAPVPRPNWQNQDGSPVPQRFEHDRRNEIAPGPPEYYPGNTPRYALPPYHYGQPPHAERIVLPPQPAPVYIETPYVPYRSYGTSSNGGFYIGPGGWRFGAGGLQFDFHDHGHRGHNNHGHRGHHKHHDD